jgi:hypothetical protein
VVITGKRHIVHLATDLFRQHRQRTCNTWRIGPYARFDDHPFGDFGLNKLGHRLEMANLSAQRFGLEPLVDPGKPERGERITVRAANNDPAAMAAGNLLGNIGGIAVASNFSQAFLVCLTISDRVGRQSVERQPVEKRAALPFRQVGHQRLAGRGRVQWRDGLVRETKACVVGTTDAGEDQILAAPSVEHGDAIGLGHLATDGQQKTA